MNYFELFGIPVSLQVDSAALTPRYFALQKKYHPDFYGQASEAEKEEALEMSSMANKALKTFQNPDETLRYVLQLKGLLEEEEKYQLPPQFLMEVIELNEMRMDDAPPEEIAGRVQGLQHEIYDAVRHIIANYRDETAQQSDLLAVKEYYYKKKYLDRLLEQG